MSVRQQQAHRNSYHCHFILYFPKPQYTYLHNRTSTMVSRRLKEKVQTGKARPALLLVAAAFGLAGFGALRLASTSTSITDFSSSSTFSESANNAQLRRRLTPQASKGPPSEVGQLPTHVTECPPISSPKQSERPLSPTVVASYPGSGAKMTWKLIEALTGLLTGDEHITHLRSIGREVVPWNKFVTVKAHYPHKMGDPIIGPETATSSREQRIFSRAILLMRNPADALPGFHNFIYEQENQLENHSTRAPLEEWIRWRDANFAEEVQAYERHIAYWMEQYPTTNDLLVLTYEEMTADESGPLSANALADFLRQADGVDPVEGTDVDCAWTKVIKYKGKNPPPQDASTPVAVVERRQRRRLQDVPGDSIARSGSKFRPYTQEQIVEMLAMLNRLRARFGDTTNAHRNANTKHLLSILDVYFEKIRTLADVDGVSTNIKNADASPSPQQVAKTHHGDSLHAEQPSVDLDLAVYDQALRRVDDPASFSPTDKMFFYHIPKSGGTSIELHYHYCLGLNMPHVDANEGISPQDFDEAVILKTNMMHHISLFQDRPIKARAFGLFRHPAEVVQSEYYYLQVAAWEGGYNKNLGNEMTVEEYAASRPNRLIQNVLMMGGQETTNVITDEDLQKAKMILHDYVLIGLMDQVEESLDRFDTFLGVSALVSDTQRLERCRQEGRKKVNNSNKHPKLGQDSQEWQQIAAHNQYDIALYEYAVQLFAQQGENFSTNK